MQLSIMVISINQQLVCNFEEQNIPRTISDNHQALKMRTWKRSFWKHDFHEHWVKHFAGMWFPSFCFSSFSFWCLEAHSATGGWATGLIKEEKGRHVLMKVRVFMKSYTVFFETPARNQFATIIIFNFHQFVFFWEMSIQKQDLLLM